MLGCNPICTVFYSSFFISYSLFLFQPCYASYNYLTPNQTLIDSQTLVSAGENFTLGFFSPHNSQHRYLGIWYTKISVQTVVWLANRDNPIPDSTGILKIVDDGNLQILYGNGSVVWSSNTSVLSKNPIAQLLDSGNLVLGDGPSSGNVIWQSYDEPTDSFLPGMRLGLNQKTGKIWKLISWKSPENPSSGNYTFSYNKEGSVDRLFEGVILEGSKLRWRTGSWDGRTFIGVPIMETTYRFGFQVVDNIENGDLYVTFSTAAFSTRIENYLLNSTGFMNYRYWNEEIKQWVTELEHPGEKCEIYGFCGPNCNCDPDHSPICSCLYGFEPKSAGDWAMGRWSDGCVRRIPLGCEKNSSGGGDGFLTLVGMKIPDRSGWIPAGTDEDCVAECRKNCSCVAYLHTSGLGCFVWVGDLIDVRKFPKGGLDFYVRLAGAELEAKGRGKKLVIVIVTIVSVILICGCIFFLWMRMAKKRESKDKEEADVLNLDTSIITSPDTSDAKAHGNTIEKGKKLLMLDLHIVAIATDNFSITNKLGEGGFGAVYKGVLPNGKEIAVKRLSRCSCQGLEEFKNEVIIIAKLQHRNLVRLLGCCIDRGEKLLVYDYMPNKSLDGFLFDETKRRLLDWRRRFIIIEGIARGLLYLHRDSRLRIIHRDLKPSNILLDDQMNPKISDFGMARIFGGNQSQANTKRIVGTYGYMSPEYAMEGRFSEKSDVFSFGIIVLEIVSGKTNNMFHQHSLTLTGYAWMLWNDDNGLELVDPLLCNSFHAEEVLKCIHVALLCVQESANNRPTISSILSMLGSEATILPTPKKPAFFIDAGSSDTSSSMNGLKHFSKNDLTTSTITGR